jgi:hypothetical protein
VNAVVEYSPSVFTDFGSGARFRKAITAVEKIILSVDQSECPVKHHFSPGLYIREMTIPEGTVLTGKVHKTEHLCIMCGDLELASDGLKARMIGFHVLESKVGAKRLGLAHKETIFTTIHATNETDIEKLEKELFCNTYEEFDKFIGDVWQQD